MKSFLKSLDNALDRHRLRHTSTGLGFAFSDSIFFINTEAWDKVVKNASVFLSRSYLGALESSRTPGLVHRYALIFDGKNPVAAISTQIYDVNATHFGKTDQHFKKNPQLFKSFKGRTLICGNLFSCGPHGIATVKEVDRGLLWCGIAEALYRIRRAERLNGQADFMIIKDIEGGANSGIDQLKTFSYRPLKTEPNMVIALDPSWKRFDDYLNQLTSKYRKSIHSIFKDFDASGCVVDHCENIEPYASVLHSLYSNVWSRTKIRLGILSENFLPLLAAGLGPDIFRCTLVRKGDLVVGFVTIIRDGDTAVGYYIGVDYETNATSPVYFRLLYSVIETAIQWGCAKISLGRTALEVKAKMGGQPIPMDVWIRHRVPMVNVLIRQLLGLIPHDEPPNRSPFKSAS